MNTLESNYTNSYYDRSFIKHKNIHGEFPQSINDVFNEIEIEGSELIDYKNFFFHDPFSKNSEFIKYIPVYSSATKKRVAGLIISTGIDGHFSNSYLNDTLFQENYQKHLEIYNTTINTNNFYSEFGDTTFSVWNYFFGKKDFVVEFIQE